MRTPLTYAGAGVDIDRGDEFVQRIAPLARSTRRPGVLGGLGGFGGLFALDGRWKDPVLVSGTDGVGTKLKLAFLTGRHGTVGIDLVAMCVNDVLCSGAEPLFFLDYFASGHLDVEAAAAVVGGIAQGCLLAGCALLGGETAELPGFYPGGEYDLAGFAVAVVERDRLLDPRRVQVGDLLVGLPSSGLHANGFSLARQVLLQVQGRDLLGPACDPRFADLAAELLEPTRIYVRPVLEVLAHEPVHGIAHVTGGGLPGNVPRCLPNGTRAVLDRRTWAEPLVMRALREAGVADDEMQRTFNLGLGLVLVVPRDRAQAVVDRLVSADEAARVVGEVVAQGTDSADGEADCVLEP